MCIPLLFSCSLRHLFNSLFRVYSYFFALFYIIPLILSELSFANLAFHSEGFMILATSFASLFSMVCLLHFYLHSIYFGSSFGVHFVSCFWSQAGRSLW